MQGWKLAHVFFVIIRGFTLVEGVQTPRTLDVKATTVENHLHQIDIPGEDIKCDIFQQKQSRKTSNNCLKQQQNNSKSRRAARRIILTPQNDDSTSRYMCRPSRGTEEHLFVIMGYLLLILHVI